MKVITTLVGNPEKDRTLDWPATLPLPREGESVELPWGSIYVRTVAWYPLGEDEISEPFVYLVLGPRHP
jgi:hypothetical protein